MSAKKIRSTSQQIRYLSDFMKTNPMFAAGDNRGPLGKIDEQWKRLSEELAKMGPIKSVEQWKQTWRDLKRKARNDAAASRNNTDSLDEVSISKMSQKVLSIIGEASATVFRPMESSKGRAAENADKTSKSAQKQKKSPHQAIFEKVRRYCVELVKQCDRPIEILDDVPFRNILNLIVVRDGDRKNLTAAAIQEFIDNAGDALDDTTLDTTAQLDEEDEHDVFDNDDGDSDYVPPCSGTASQKHGAIKGEKMQCNCQGEDGDDEGAEHEIGCPMHSEQHYWAYFEVSVEDARCKECHRNVKWTTMTDLKTHLDVHHSHLRYKDDDENFTGGGDAMSEAGSFANLEVTEEVFLDTDSFPTEKHELKAKKRKLPPVQTTKYVTLKDSQTITLDRFKCLDRFGLYIAALMKMIPEDKCIKYQEQIVNRLLREQAAAG